MALFAGYFLMLTLQRKAGSAMVEQPGLPILGFVAPAAISLAFHGELLIVGIRMAVLAKNPEPAEHLLHWLCPVRFEMTAPAGRCAVLAAQGKGREGMIEGDIFPGVF